MKALLALRSVGFCVGQRQMCLNVRWVSFFFVFMQQKYLCHSVVCFVFFTMNGNVMQLCFVRVFKVLIFQSFHKPNLLIRFYFVRIIFTNFYTIANLNLAFFRWSNAVSFTHSPRMKYRCCYGLGLYLQTHYNSIPITIPA